MIPHFTRMSAQGNNYVSPYRDTVRPSNKIADDFVDVAKQKLDVSVGNNTTLTIDNHEESFKNLLNAIPVRGPVCVVMEATRAYERKLVAFLQAREIEVAVVNPKRVRDYAKAMSAYAKNDRIDADMIRHYAQPGCN